MTLANCVRWGLAVFALSCATEGARADTLVLQPGLNGAEWSGVHVYGYGGQNEGVGNGYAFQGGLDKSGTGSILTEGQFSTFTFSPGQLTTFHLSHDKATGTLSLIFSHSGVTKEEVVVSEWSTSQLSGLAAATNGFQLFSYTEFASAAMNNLAWSQQGEDFESLDVTIDEDLFFATDSGASLWSFDWTLRGELMFDLFADTEGDWFYLLGFQGFTHPSVPAVVPVPLPLAIAGAGLLGGIVLRRRMGRRVGQ